MAPRKTSGRTSSGARGRGRNLKVRVKTARGRKVSSTRWLERQLNDPYVDEARRRGLRSRSAFKLIEIDDRFGLLRSGAKVVDLGAAPGGWSQVAAERTGADTGHGIVVAVDLSDVEPIPGVEVLRADFLDDRTPEKILQLLGGAGADLVLSDMAAPSSGHKRTDHLKIMGLCEAALAFAGEVLRPQGAFLAKVLQGGTEDQLLAAMKRDFTLVRHVKPNASRQESSELYVLATGFRGASGEPA